MLVVVLHWGQRQTRPSVTSLLVPCLIGMLQVEQSCDLASNLFDQNQAIKSSVGPKIVGPRSKRHTDVQFAVAKLLDPEEEQQQRPTDPGRTSKRRGKIARLRGRGVADSTLNSN